MDLDSASEEDVADDGELDDNHADDHDVHAVGADDGTKSCSSFNSWHLPLSCNLQELELQSHDDTMSIASSQSFKLAYQVLDNEDNASISSFQMVPTTAPSVADPDEQQEQQQQQDQEQQQQDAHELHQLEQEPDMGADVASNVGDGGSNVGSNVSVADPDDQQPDAQGIDKEKQSLANELVKWKRSKNSSLPLKCQFTSKMCWHQLQTAATAKATAAAAAATTAATTCPILLHLCSRRSCQRRLQRRCQGGPYQTSKCNSMEML